MRQVARRLGANDSSGGLESPAIAHQSARQPCLRMSAVSVDYHHLVRARCAKCQGQRGECLLGLFDEALRDLAI